MQDCPHARSQTRWESVVVGSVQHLLATISRQASLHVLHGRLASTIGNGSIDVYVSQQTSLARIAETLGCSPTTVHAALVDHGIDIRTSDDFSHVEALRDPRWLKNRYVDQQRTMREIANELGCSHVTVERAIRAQGINARPSQPRSADRPPARVGPPSEAEIQVSTLRVIHELGHQVDVAEVRSFIEQRWQHSRLARDVVDLALAHFRRRIDRA